MNNPYYSPEKLGLEMLEFDEPDLSYEYNTLCFWATPEGLIYTAKDSGCSCPCPFEDYEGTTMEEAVAKMERIGSPEQAESILRVWNRGNFRGEPILSGDPVKKLRDWIAAKLRA